MTEHLGYGEHDPVFRGLARGVRERGEGLGVVAVLLVFLPEGPWTADRGTCLHRQGGREIHISVIGTYDTAERRWLWGCSHPGLRGTAAVAVAEQARQL
ncbi:DUF6882 domain-containing protein [Kitasatospora sp. HPMI-4]|uniref:DUF6882 domain-containing protein n=1 Tax=Kitasatospora sp. HPMI-4 TaxID=3448443 RepID=UPI003F1CA49A